MPAFCVKMMAEYIDRSFKRTSEAAELLVEQGLLARANEGKRNRLYYAPEVMRAYMAIDALR